MAGHGRNQNGQKRLGQELNGEPLAAVDAGPGTFRPQLPTTFLCTAPNFGTAMGEASVSLQSQPKLATTALRWAAKLGVHLHTDRVRHGRCLRSRTLSVVVSISQCRFSLLLDPRDWIPFFRGKQTISGRGAGPSTLCNALLEPGGEEVRGVESACS
jgi:hypothetical protein